MCVGAHAGADNPEDVPVQFPTPPPASRASTPEPPPNSPPGSAPGSLNRNGKCPMMQPAPFPISLNDTPPLPKKPSKRQKDRLASAKEALVTFHFKTKDEFFTPSLYTASAIFPDQLLNALAAHAAIITLEDLEEAAGVQWLFGKLAFTNGKTLFDQAQIGVSKLDQEHEEQKARVKQLKAEETAARKLAERLEKEEKKREENRRKQEEEEELGKLQAIEAEERQQQEIAQGWSFSRFSSSPSVSAGPSMMFTSELNVCSSFIFISLL